MDKNSSKPTPKHFTLVYVKYKCKERKKVTKHSSSQSLPAAAACLSFPPSSQQKFKPKPAKNTSWACERELRLWVKAKKLFRGKEKGAGMGGKKLTEERELKEEEEGEKREKERKNTTKLSKPT